LFNILIVDDEDVERDGVAYLIKEYNLPLKVAEARNGKLALEYIENNHVDILLTDIKMPFIGGLELVRKAREIDGNIKVIIFSAYGEFDYAKEAVKLDAFYYLLKPVVIEEFIEVMNNVIQLCMDEAEKKKQDEILLESYEKMKTYGQKKLLLDIINGIRLDDKFFKRFNLLDMNFDISHVFMVLLNFKQMFFDSKNDSLEEELSKLLNWQYNYINLNEYQSILFIEQNRNKPEKNEIINFGQELMNTISERYEIPVCIVVSKPIERIDDIFKEYLHIEQLMEYRFFFNESMLLFSWNEEARLGIGEDVVEKIVKNINLSLETQDYYSFEQGVQLLFRSFKNKYSSIILCKYTCAEITKNLLAKIGRTNISNFDNMLEKVFNADSLDSLQEIIMELLWVINNNLANNDIKSTGKNINEILDNIHKNYVQDISLESIGKAVYLSPGYLSAFFKKEMGQSLMKYITCYRLKKAKELLVETNMKVVDVSKNVGFSDVSYFCMVFRNYFGMSPTRYRERNI